MFISLQLLPPLQYFSLLKNVCLQVARLQSCRFHYKHLGPVYVEVGDPRKVR